MKCIKCSNKAVVFLKHMGRFCSKCFLITIEKRIRKDLNVNKVFSPRESVLVLDDNSLKARLAIFFLNSISRDIPLKIDIKKTKPKKHYDKIVTPDDLDDDITAFLESLFTAGRPAEDCKEVHLLRTVTDEEIAILARLLKINLSVKKSRLSPVLDTLEKNYPGSKFGLFNSIRELK